VGGSFFGNNEATISANIFSHGQITAEDDQNDKILGLLF
jgi:hypothetical protein